MPDGQLKAARRGARRDALNLIAVTFSDRTRVNLSDNSLDDRFILSDAPVWHGQHHLRLTPSIEGVNWYHASQAATERREAPIYTATYFKLHFESLPYEVAEAIAAAYRASMAAYRASVESAETPETSEI